MKQQRASELEEKCGTNLLAYNLGAMPAKRRDADFKKNPPRASPAPNATTHTSIMTDRRRINAPSGGTSAPIFARTVKDPDSLHMFRPTRTRRPDELRKICKSPPTPLFSS